MNSYQALKKHPGLLWLIPAGLVLLAPILVTLILYTLTTMVLAQGANATAALVSTGIFLVITLLSFSFWNALVINAIALAKTRKKFSLVHCFKGIRPVFARSILLLILTVAWLLLVSYVLGTISSSWLHSVVLLVALVSLYVFFSAGGRIHSQPLKTALYDSLTESFTARRIVSFAGVCVLAVAAVGVVALGQAELISSVGWKALYGVAITLSGMAMFTVFSPVFGFLLVAGGLGYVHVFAVFVISLVLHVVSMLIVHR